MKILVIDDDAAQIELAEMVLAAHAVETCTGCGAALLETALARIASGGYDCIITDIDFGMGMRMGGVQVVAACIDRGIPVIACTGREIELPCPVVQKGYEQPVKLREAVANVHLAHGVQQKRP